jgi:hypothetical protein
MRGKTLMKRKGILRSNLDGSIQIGRPLLFLLHHDAYYYRESARRHGRRMGAPVLSLRCSDLDVVSFYGIIMTRSNRFANLWRRRRSAASWHQRRTLSDAWHRSGRLLCSSGDEKGAYKGDELW